MLPYSGMKYIIIAWWLLSVSIGAPGQAQQFSLQNPPATLSMLGEGFISTAMNERDFALSPDGREIFYTVSLPKSGFQTIVYSKQIKPGQWSAPEVASFAGNFSDIEPVFSSDGNTLYFASNRPLEGDQKKDFDIWKVKRVGSGWSAAENMGATINTAADEFYPSIANNGNLYFTASYKGGPGREDIYVSVLSNNEYQKPVELDTAINTKFFEFNAFVDPAERFILFTSYGRKDDSGSGDLYISQKDAAGKWQPSRNVSMLNSKQLDYCPFVSADGKILFLTSERHQLPANFKEKKATYQSIQRYYDQPLNSTGNIYWIDFNTVVQSLK